jgi:uncharacterized membrane protein YbhN (UPF0104 family)
VSGRWKRWLKWGALAVGTILAVRALEHFPWRRVWHALAAADPGWVLVAAVLSVLSLLLKGWGWHLLMMGGRGAGLRESLRAHMLGATAMVLTVSVGSEAVRVGAIVPRLGVTLQRAVAAAAWSRIAEAIALVGLLLPASLLAMPPELQHLRFPAAVLAAVAVVVVALLLAPGLRRGLLLPALLRLFPPRWRERVGEITAVGVGTHMAGPLLLALLNWLAQWASYDAAMRAVGIHAPPSAALAVIVAVNLGGLLHLTPGNVGVLQAGTVLTLGAFGVAAADALAAGLILQAVQALPPILIGAALVWRPWRSWRPVAPVDVDAAPESAGGA